MLPLQRRFTQAFSGSAQSISDRTEAAQEAGFIRWYPRASGDLAKAWFLKHGHLMLPIPRTSQVFCLEEKVAATLELSESEFQQLDQATNGS